MQIPVLSGLPLVFKSFCLEPYRNVSFVLEGTSLQTDKLNISQTFQQWSCNSGCTPSFHCRLPRCSSVAFPKTFSGSEKV